ncbi:MAG: hypothetical protein ACOYS2_00075 [Patescibacteria group bacterium]
MNLGFGSQKDNWKKIFGRIADFWVRYNSWIFISVWVAVALLTFSLWYFWIFRYEWSQERKEAYRKETGQGVLLDEKKYQRVLLEMENRRRRISDNNLLQARDIFGLTK